MKRDRKGNLAYWDKWVNYGEESMAERRACIGKPAENPDYLPQYIYELSTKNCEQMLRRYSRGDAVAPLSSYFDDLLSAWTEAERLGKDVWDEDTQYTRHAWKVNIDHYVRCFWLIGLALSLQIPDEQWQRLLALMGNEGADALLDSVIATRQPERKIGQSLCFPKAYKRLLKVIEAAPEQRPQLLRDYLDSWFPSLQNAGHPSFPKDHRTPYWWDFCEDVELGMHGGYYGCWCVEAVAVAKAFHIDDSLCLDHPYYPGDLIKDGRCPRYPDPPDAIPRSWFSRVFGKK